MLHLEIAYINHNRELYMLLISLFSLIFIRTIQFNQDQNAKILLLRCKLLHFPYMPIVRA